MNCDIFNENGEVGNVYQWKINVVIVGIKQLDQYMQYVIKKQNEMYINMRQAIICFFVILCENGVNIRHTGTGVKC